MGNKQRIIAALLLIIILVVNHYLTKEDRSFEVSPEESMVTDFDFLPTSTTKQLIKHNYYNLSYSEQHEQPEWVAYVLDKEHIVYTNFERPYFIEDPKVKTGSADWRNYKKSGYDRGHLCPAGDRRFSQEAFNETFYTSNITPQKHDFNAGIWNKLEQKVRYWAKKYNRLYVVTGAVLTDKNLKGIGEEDVTVANAFYKVVLDYTKPEIKAIAFLMPHKESKKPLYEFVVSIDDLEKKTGIDFFHKLPDNLEKQLESSTNYKNWAFK